jgi:hypothetical protein
VFLEVKYKLEGTEFFSLCVIEEKTVEAAMKGKDLEEALLELAAKRGLVFYEELEYAFPAEYFPLGELERFLMLLEDLGVAVVPREQWQKPRNGHGHRRNKKAA